MTTNPHDTFRLKPLSARGFTLPELMVTIVILAVVVSIAVPSMNQFLMRQELNAKSNVMVSTLAYARNEAVARVTKVVLCGTTNGVGCNGSSDLSNGWLLFTDLDNNNEFSAGDELLKQGPAESKTLLVKLVGSATFISYADNGESNAITTIAMCSENAGSDPSKSRTLTVSIAGSSRISVGAACT